MKILLLSIGTRGDMEPFLAIGELLRAKGNHVICAFPEQFRKMAEDSNLEFVSLGLEYIEILESDVGKIAMGEGGSGFRKITSNIKLAREQSVVNKELVFRQHEIIERENPERVLYNGKAVYPVIWGLEHKGKNILLCMLPYMHTVRDHTHILFNRNMGSFLNRLTYALADFGQNITIRISAHWLKIKPQITHKQVKKALQTNTAIYTISPSLFPRPDYWGRNLKVLGFHERNRTTNWRPDETLTKFLEKHQKERILFVTFGSMSNPAPEEKTSLLVDILERHKIPAIINTASGGLVKPNHFNSELIHFVPQIPYNWIFPKIHGVIHHGGSGTTHLALKYGCASLLIPHIIDQFVWDSIIDRLGAGPKGIKISKISTRSLEPKILDLINNSTYKKNAEQIARQMAQEDFQEELCETIVGLK